MTGIRFLDGFPCMFALFFLVAPWIVAFTWMQPDANRRGQPGVVWALGALPLGWLAILAYLVTRTVADSLGQR
jgi:hypothetical protein